MPVYNVASYIEATINSVLAQTFTDFELLVLDDCSTDGTAAIVERLATTDARLRFFRNPHNLGRAGTDNVALAHATGEYIAKMDGDDICHPERLARQVAYLEQHPDRNVVGSWMQNFDASTYLNRYPAAAADAQVLTLFTLPTGNPSVMLRASLFREQGMRYDDTLRQSEDYDFFARYLRQLRIHTLPEALIRYRVPPNAGKKRILTERATVADEVRERLLREWGVACSDRELRVHQAISMLRPETPVPLAEVEAWLRKLVHHNETHPLFEPEALQRGLQERWFEACYTYQQPRLGSLRQFGQSRLGSGQWRGSQLLKLLLKSIRNF